MQIWVALAFLTVLVLASLARPVLVPRPRPARVRSWPDRSGRSWAR